MIGIVCWVVIQWTCGICGNTYSTNQPCPYCN